MRTIPILFSTPMVQAILDGRKTMTRRIITPRSSYFDGDTWPKWITPEDMDWNDVVIDKGPSPTGNPGPYLKVKYPAEDTRHRIYPRVFPGDVFWCRETWAEAGNFASDEFANSEVIAYKTEHALFYPFDIHDYKELDTFSWAWDKIKWKPSIYMPKSVCRLFLEVTNVRAERLHDISEKDAIAEGVGHGFQMNAGWPDYTRIRNGICELTQDTAEMSFSSLWESINGKESWNANPWVWVYEFKQIEKPENFN